MTMRRKDNSQTENERIAELALRLEHASDSIVRTLDGLKDGHINATVSLSCDLSPTSKTGWLHRATELLRSAISENSAGNSVLDEQSLWCFQCQSPDCDHARAASERHVFIGYSATGKVLWRPFLDVCLERRPQGLDGLYAPAPGVVVMQWTRDELNEERIDAFRTGYTGYEVLSQIVVGLLGRRLTPSGDRGAEFRVPLAIQVVRLTEANGAEPYQIKIMGIPWRKIDEAAANKPPRHPAQQLSSILRQIRKKLRSLPKRVAVLQRRHQTVDGVDLVERLMGRVAGDLRRIYRVDEGRTKHAQARHRSGERPTQAAWADSRSITPEKLLFDIRRDTFVVVGKKGRAHIFSPAGKHITSLKLDDGEIDRKMRKKRWRLVNAEEFNVFQRVTTAVGQRA